MAIVKLYLHVCKQAAVCQKTLVTELLPLLGLKKPGFEKPSSDVPAPRSSPGNLRTGAGTLQPPGPMLGTLVLPATPSTARAPRKETKVFPLL